MPLDAHAVRDPRRLDAVVKEALAKRPDLLILGGGDGTISGCVDHLVGTDTVLGVLPLGTANSFCRTLGIDCDNLESAVSVLTDGEPRAIDLGAINGDYFANVTAIGLPSLIGKTVPHGLKAALGRVGYALWAFYQLARFRPFQVIVTDVAGNRHHHDAVEVRIANGNHLGGTLISEAAQLDSGELAILLTPGRSRPALLWQWTRAILGLGHPDDGQVVLTGARFTIATDPPLPVSIDGEIRGETPIEAHIARQVIRVMAPMSDPDGE